MLYFIEVHMGGEPVCINVRYIRDIYQCADDEKMQCSSIATEK